MAATKKRLDALTSLRFFAALLVVFLHTQRTWLGAWRLGLATPLRNLLNTGYVSVGFFFVLSGFVLAYSYGQADRIDVRARSFWRARFARIYPVFALSLLVGAGPAFMILHREYPGAQGYLEFGKAMLANIGMLSVWIDKVAIVNGPGWSLSAEAFFYALFPFVAPVFWRLRGRSLLLGIVGLIGATLVIPLLASLADPALWAWKADDPVPVGALGPLGSIAIYVKWNPLMRMLDFFLGICLGKLFLNRRAEGASHGWAIVAQLALVTAVLTQAHRVPYLMLHSGLLNLPFALIIYLAAADRGWFSRALAIGPLVLLGEASYALYILHVPLRNWASFVIGQVGALKAVPGPVWFAAFSLGSVLVSIAVFKWFEQPMRVAIRDYKPAGKQSTQAQPVPSAV